MNDIISIDELRSKYVLTKRWGDVEKSKYNTIKNEELVVSQEELRLIEQYRALDKFSKGSFNKLLRSLERNRKKVIIDMTENLKNVVEESGFSLTSLSGITGIEQQLIEQALNGKGELTPVILRKLSVLFDLAPNNYVKWEPCVEESKRKRLLRGVKYHQRNLKRLNKYLSALDQENSEVSTS